MTAYSDFSVTQGQTITAGIQNANMINIRHVINGTDATAAPVDSLVSLRTAINGASAPVGAIMPYSGTTAPTDYLMTDGSSLNKITYSELFAVIGFSFGGTGNTYSLPDTKGAHIRGVGTSTIFTQNQTITLAQTLNDQIQGHYHTQGDTNETWNTGDGGTPANVQSGSGAGTMHYSATPYTRSPSSDGTNGTPRTGNETRPNSIGLNFIIKYQ